MSKVDPRPDFFIISVEAPDGQPKAAWVFPSIVFDAYAARPAKGSPRDLDLDSGVRKYGVRLRDVLSGFRDRWELLLDYEKYEAWMESAEDLEDILTMKEAREAPKEEAISLEEYKRGRPATLSS